MTTYSNSFIATQLKCSPMVAKGKDLARFNQSVTDGVQSFLINKELGHSIAATSTPTGVILSLVAKSGDVLNSVSFETSGGVSVVSMTYDAETRLIDTKLSNDSHIYCALDAIYTYVDLKVATEASTREASDTTLQANITSEASTRATADITLQANIDAEKEIRSSADTTLQNNITAEETARTTGDNNLSQAISTETTQRLTTDNLLSSSILSEITNRTNADAVLLGNIDAEESTRASADTTLTNNLNTEIADREAGDTALGEAIDAEESRATEAEEALQDNIDQEVLDRTAADTTLQTNITAETTARQTADEGLQASINTKASQTSVDLINAKIPTQATSSNLLADKDFVNSSINSVTAFYITKNAAGDQFSTKAELDSTTTFYSGGVVRVPTRNDYCIVLSDETHSNATTRYIYYTAWQFQYKINDTPFTAAQLAAINSGVTSTKVSDIDSNTAARHTHSNKSLLDTYTLTEADLASAVTQKHSHSNKQVLDGISSTNITNWNTASSWVTTNGSNTTSHIANSSIHVTASDKSTWNAKYDLPATGIPKTDLAASVQTSLGKADTALQLHQSLSAYRTATAQDIIDATKVDKVAGKGLSTEDYTTAEKTKLAGIATGATATSVSSTGTATDEVQFITINGVEKKLAGSSAAVGAVRYDEAQSLTDTLKTLARTNIGAIGTSDESPINPLPVIADTLTGVSNATVGLVATVASVDGSGNVTSWSLSNKENSSNKVTSISSSSTDVLYPSAKCVYDNIITKQNVIDASHKLSADLISDGSTNKTVTQTEKNTWNGKSVVSVASTGSSTDEVKYITINGTEKKLSGGTEVIWRTY